MNNNASGSLRLAASLPLLLMTAPAMAQTAGEGNKEIEQVIVTGTRVANRSALDTAVPVDVVSGEQLQNLGVSEVSQALSVTVPSFNFPRPGLNDGTDTVRPATLRGLAPDQTLVLVNGKRRHQSALININNSIGRGSTAVDLNTIPNAIIQSVEVLRDGASAQYGSDAIAGVINLRLRTDNEGGDAGVIYGWRETSYDVLVGSPPTNPPGANFSSPPRRSRDMSDGETLTVSAWKGLPIGTTGSVVIAAEYKDQEHTERGGYDMRRQYPLVNGAYDPREATFDRYNSWYGEPELDQKTVFVNAEYEVASGASIYGWASWQDRDAVSAGFYRIAGDDRNTIQIYPDGFLPLIAPDVVDISAAVGTSWRLGEWDMDSSLTYGRNEMDYEVRNSLNRSLGTASPTTFDSGGFDYDQLTLNVSGVRTVDVGLASPLNIAVGVEARRETFSIHAGEPNSYLNGGVRLANGNPTQSGAQVFPGFRPENEVDEDRTAVGAYIDLEANITEKFLTSVALRGESYSDFGENLAGKLSLRYDFVPQFAMRASVQNGFKAPSLQQQYFSTTSTNFIGGLPFDIATFPVNNPAAIALGAQPLDAEESLNYSLGAVARLGDLTITVDAYRIDIEDRIVLSENLTSPDVVNYLTGLGFVGIGGGRFFINGVDTTTEGVDIVMSYPWSTDAAGRFDFTVTANFNSTDVTKVPTTPQLSALPTPPILFNRFNVLSYEEGTPENKFSAMINWTLGGWGATLRATRYGEVLSPDPNPTLDFTLSATTLVDLEARLAITEHIKLAFGADNITDEYPDPLPPQNNLTGTQSFSNYSPFGRSGRFVYGRVNYTF
ncbi:TonB-dependent receptor plug domain-containing protein [Steroidobacter agaridevorans]|uniref:TonB-dependent receptor plug domain-containing protein n=1 Tax=Steroidobacter agaridevorans TaxID=2695856 RepID=UPI001322E6A4|nr:TonB-dependent receptor [Steroidobacter agaridevorans]GFE90469.1 TonB-dependent receptor [Steroidobacter agaridevorans]